MPDTKLSALSELSIPALEDLAYLVDDPAGTPASVRAPLNRLLGLVAPGICQGRLTLEAGVPISTSDQTAQSDLHFTPYLGNRVGLYDGTRWRLYTFTERDLTLSSLTSGKNYDVFLYDNSGTLTLELSAAWTNDTTRADALALQDGAFVKDGATTRRWLGTIRTTGTTTTEDSQTKRFVWNAYHRVARHLYKADTSAHTYNTEAWRYWDGNSAVKLEFLDGWGGLGIEENISVVWVGPGQIIVGPALNQDTAEPDFRLQTVTTSYEAYGGAQSKAARLGYNFIAALEFGHASSNTFNSLRVGGLIEC